ncbi:MarR family winged helix-turn-helix transcriptional regulator [Geothrix alkalitolerans]|uniref:MarR family winged helix-turn-helix transcriptional regulator n=1 Tax=Geothrix alkalitolerans TaxID=2922724 RepID=UPI001FAED940|nr:MarR family transcriptional regulator [Geothrix alkalitolerans]
MQSLRRIVKALHDYSMQVEKQCGLTGPQLWALWELNRAGTLSLKALSKQMHLEPSTVTGVVERLHKRGLLTREPDPADRRRVMLSLTAEGSQLLKGAPHPAQGQLLYALHGMDLDSVASLNQSLKRLASDMEVDATDARFFFAEG